MLERIKKRQSRMGDGECQEGVGTWLHEACDHHTQFSFVKKRYDVAMDVHMVS